MGITRLSETGIGVNRYLTLTETDGLFNPRERAICRDGFSISIQAGIGYYCKYTNEMISHVELGYPSEADSLISGFADDPKTIDTLYPCVPLYLVETLVLKHGGIIGYIKTEPIECGILQ